MTAESKRYLKIFLLRRQACTDGLNKSTVTEVIKPAKTTISEAIKWTHELKIFAVKRALEGEHANMLSVEEL